MCHREEGAPGRQALHLCAYLLAGCNSLNKLFSSDDDKAGPDAALPVPDAALPGAEAGPPVVPPAALDSAPALAIPESPAPSATAETPAIKTAVGALATALGSRDLATAAAQFAPAVRGRYQTMFERAATAELDRLTAALAQVDVTAVVNGSVDGTLLRSEVVVALDGRTFHVGLVKQNGQWLLESL